MRPDGLADRGRAGGQTGGRTDGRADRRTGGQTEGWTDGRIHRQSDRQTDVTKLIFPFRNFANAPKNVIFALHAYEKLSLTYENFTAGSVQNNFN